VYCELHEVLGKENVIYILTSKVHYTWWGWQEP